MPTHRSAVSRAKLKSERTKKLLNKTVFGGVVASALINTAEATPVTDAEATLATALTNLATMLTNLATDENAFITQANYAPGGNIAPSFATALPAANSASASASAAATMTGSAAVTGAANAISASISATNAMASIESTSWYQAGARGLCKAQCAAITAALTAITTSQSSVTTAAAALNTALLTTSTTMNTSISSSSSTVVQTSPTITQTSPTVTQTSPTVAQTSPTVTQTSPTVTQTSPTVTQTSPTVTQTSPTVTQTSPTVTQTSPTVTQTSPTVTQTSPTVTQTSPTITQTSPTNPSIDAVSSSQITTMLPMSSTEKYTISTTPTVQTTTSVNQIPSATTDDSQKPSIGLNASSLVGIVVGVVGTALMALTGVALWRRWVGKNKTTTQEPVMEQNTHPMIANPLHPETQRTLSSTAHVYLELFGENPQPNQVQAIGPYYETPVPLYAARWSDDYPGNQLPPQAWSEQDYAITQRSVLNLSDYDVPADEESSTDVHSFQFSQ